MGFENSAAQPSDAPQGVLPQEQANDVSPLGREGSNRFPNGNREQTTDHKLRDQTRKSRMKTNINTMIVTRTDRDAVPGSRSTRKARAQIKRIKHRRDRRTERSDIEESLQDLNSSTVYVWLVDEEVA